MYNSQYYTCEQIDERLLQGYLDDYNSQTGQSLTKAQFLTKLGSLFSKEGTIDNTLTQIGYYECDTAAGTAAKVITVANYSLFAGGSMKVKFVNKNTANNATLNINSQGAKALYYNGVRVSSTNTWDAGEVVEIYYDGTSYYANNVKGSTGDGVFDISVYNPTEGQPTPYADLATALGHNGQNVPVQYRKGGMSVKFVLTYDNKYVQYRLMSDSWSTTESDWQGVDAKPTAGSKNLTESGGVASALNDINTKIEAIDEQDVVDDSEGIVVQSDDGEDVYLSITEEGVDGKNLKSNGVAVLTEHQDISGKADKSYVDAEVALLSAEIDNKQDVIDGLSSEDIEDEDDSVEFVSDDLQSIYARINSAGIHAGAVLLSDDISDEPGKAKISYEVGMEEEDNVVFANDGGNPSVIVTPDGIKVKSLMDLEGNVIVVGGSATCYVSSSGNDTNSGMDSSHPMKTINNALEKGFCNILLMGGVYEQSINLTLCKADTISIKGARGADVVFKRAESLIADDGSETLVSGFTKVYKLENVPAISYGDTGAKWLFFDGVDDVNTAITEQEAHPLQKGKFYRCDCTKSVITTATSVNDACTEIESCENGEYKWFYNNGTLYFNRPASTSVNALYKSVGNYFTVRSEQSLVLSNIEFRYGNVNLVDLNIVKVYNCATKYVYGMGAFSYDRTISIEFVNCEASSCFHASNGDGFNASGYATNPRRTQAVFVDCWSHDNNDDGFSDHEWCESTIIGGLYEWNKKAGVTPSFGAHCTCHDVYSRNNYCGFLYVGAVNDSGNKGQLVCYNCVSESNGRGGSYKVGFGIYGTDNYNKAVLYNCLAIGEITGYGCDSTNYFDLYDCKTLNCTNQKSGNVNIYNSSSLTN